MKTEQHWLWWIGWGGIFLGIGLIVVRAQSLEDAILDLQFRIPRDPVALFGNILAIASALFLISIQAQAVDEVRVFPVRVAAQPTLPADTAPLRFSGAGGLRR